MATYTQGNATKDASTLTGDQVIAEVQEILMSEGFGLFQLFARPSERNGYTFTYKTPERLLPEAYDRTTGGALGKGAVVDQVDITADERDVVYFEIEDTEFASQILADQEKSRVGASIVQSMMAQLDAEILVTLKNGASQTAGEEVNFNGAVDQDALATARIKLGDVIADNESLIDARTLGVPSIRQIVILSPKAYWRYINSFDTNVLSQSQEIKMGKLVIRQINGSLVIKHPLIGKDYAAGVLHKTKTYDLSTDAAGSTGKTLEGFVVTDVAAAIPFAMTKTSKRINEFGNEEIIARYVYGTGVIRPGLIKMIIGG